MTDSMSADTGSAPTAELVGGKRERLVAGARQLLHAQGVENTTLADIAQVADVPVGNVYYYFKTKDELVHAVVTAHGQEVAGALAALERHRTPKARLKALVRMLAGKGELTARYGCPQGSLCSELDKRDDEVAAACAQLIALPIEWSERQFRDMGRRDAGELG
jgi:AcrR family transcriptional regulator